MTETVTTKLRQACRTRELAYKIRPDQPLYGPRPFIRYWGCAFGEADGEVAAFVKAPGVRSSKRALIEAIAVGEPPTVTVQRRGVVLDVVDYAWVVVRFDDGDLERFGRPTWPASCPGSRLEVLSLADEPDPLLRWPPEPGTTGSSYGSFGRGRITRPVTDSLPSPRVRWPREGAVLAEDRDATRPWVLEAFNWPLNPSRGVVTVRPALVDVPHVEPPLLGRVGDHAWGHSASSPVIYRRRLWDARWETNEPVLFGTVDANAAAVEYVGQSGATRVAPALDTPPDWPVKAFAILTGEPPAGKLVAKQQDRVLAEAELAPDESPRWQAT